MITKKRLLRKNGNSITLSIPSEMCGEMNIGVDTVVNIVQDGDTIMMTPCTQIVPVKGVD